MAKIDVTKIEGYAEMTPEQKIAALEAYELAEESPDVKHYKDLISKANKEASDWKDKYRSTQTEAERIAAETAEAQERMKAELDEYKAREKALTYKTKLIACGMTEAEAETVSKDMPDGISDAFWTALGKQRSEIEKSVRAELMKGTPRPDGGNGGRHKTAEEIMQIKDSAERQQAIADNIELFEN